jgi:hypothetical protein
MSDPATASTPLTVGDRAVVLSLFKDFHESYRYYLRDFASLVDKNLEVNKQIAAFYERIMLLDVGTIALSVTALISLVPRFSSGQFPKQTFLWYIVPAWSLLFVSTVACRVVIQNTVKANLLSYDEWSDAVIKYNAGVIAVQLTKMTQAMTGTVTLNSKDVDVAQTFAAYAESLKKAMTAQPQQTEDTVNTAPFWVGVAITTAQIGLLLLCISAVRLLLSL